MNNTIHTEEDINECWVTFDKDNTSTVLAASTIEMFVGIKYEEQTRTIECSFIDSNDVGHWEEFSV